MSDILRATEKATTTSGWQWAAYAGCALATMAATFDPTWPKWQAVLMAAGTAFMLSRAYRDWEWRRVITKIGG